MDPSSIAGTSEKTLSIATGSFRRGTLHAGNRVRKCLRKGNRSTFLAHCVVILYVASMIDSGIHAKYGFNVVQSGSLVETSCIWVWYSSWNALKKSISWLNSSSENWMLSASMRSSSSSLTVSCSTSVCAI